MKKNKTNASLSNTFFYITNIFFKQNVSLPLKVMVDKAPQHRTTNATNHNKNNKHRRQQRDRS